MAVAGNRARAPCRSRGRRGARGARTRHRPRAASTRPAREEHGAGRRGVLSGRAPGGASHGHRRGAPGGRGKPDSRGPRARNLAPVAAVRDEEAGDRCAARGTLDSARVFAAPAKVEEIFTTQYFGGALTSAQNYRPILLLTYAVQRWIHGNRSWLFRAVNLALHAAVTGSLGEWLFALGFAAGPAFAGSALFPVPTIHVEALTSVVGRAELLASLLVFVVARLWLRATREGRIAPRPYGAALGL